jgi:hypothetical protein
MKIAVVILLTISCLCDLEAQQQAKPLVPESQKTDILIPTSSPQPIKVRLNERVKSIQVDGHHISTGPLQQRLRRHLTTVRRRLPDSDEYDQSGDYANSEELEHQDSAEGEILDGSAEEFNGADETQEGFDGQVDESGSFEDGSESQDLHDENLNSDSETEPADHESESFDHNEDHSEEIEHDSEEPVEEVEEVEDDCLYSNYDDYEAALIYAFDSIEFDIEAAYDDADYCMQGLAEDARKKARKLDEGVKVVTVDTLKACVSTFELLREIQVLMREYTNGEYAEEDQVEYVDSEDEPYEDFDSSEDYVENADEELEGEHGEGEEHHSEDEHVENHEDGSSERKVVSEEIPEEEYTNHETIDHNDIEEGEYQSMGETGETGEITVEPERRRRIRAMHIRRINKLRHLNALRHQRLIKSGRIRQVRVLPHRRAIIRRHLRRVPIQRRVVRRPLAHTVVVRRQLNGKRIVTPIVRRSVRKVVRPASLVRRPHVNANQRHA